MNDDLKIWELRKVESKNHPAFGSLLFFKPRGFLVEK